MALRNAEARRRRASDGSISRWLAGASSLAYALSCFVPRKPPKYYGNTEVCLFLAASAVPLTLAGYAAWLRHRFVGALFLVGWSYGLFAAFKYGYVRHDGHEVTAVLVLLLTSLFCLALLWPLARKRGCAHRLSILMLPLAVGEFAASTYARHAFSVTQGTQRIDPATPSNGRESHEARVDLQDIRSAILILQTRPVDRNKRDDDRLLVRHRFRTWS